LLHFFRKLKKKILTPYDFGNKLIFSKIRVLNRIKNFKYKLKIEKQAKKKTDCNIEDLKFKRIILKDIDRNYKIEKIKDIPLTKMIRNIDNAFIDLQIKYNQKKSGSIANFQNMKYKYTFLVYGYENLKNPQGFILKYLPRDEVLIWNKLANPFEKYLTIFSSKDLEFKKYYELKLNAYKQGFFFNYIFFNKIVFELSEFLLEFKYKLNLILNGEKKESNDFLCQFSKYDLFLLLGCISCKKNVSLIVSKFFRNFDNQIFLKKNNLKIKSSQRFYSTDIIFLSSNNNNNNFCYKNILNFDIKNDQSLFISLFTVKLIVELVINNEMLYDHLLLSPKIKKWHRRKLFRFYRYIFNSTKKDLRKVLNMRSFHFVYYKHRKTYRYLFMPQKYFNILLLLQYDFKQNIFLNMFNDFDINTKIIKKKNEIFFLRKKKNK
jgi:hypothetical protein